MREVKQSLNPSSCLKTCQGERAGGGRQCRLSTATPPKKNNQDPHFTPEAKEAQSWDELAKGPRAAGPAPGDHLNPTPGSSRCSPGGGWGKVWGVGREGPSPARQALDPVAAALQDRNRGDREQ